MLLVIFLSDMVLGDTQLKFEENLYLHHITGSTKSNTQQTAQRGEEPHRGDHRYHRQLVDPLNLQVAPVHQPQSVNSISKMSIRS